MSRLRRIDSVLGPATWIIAGLFVAMLILGPAVVASDRGSAAGSTVYSSGAAARGAEVFKANCGSCHTLSAAGTSGQTGPDLNASTLSAAAIEVKVRGGGGGMPAFASTLSDAQIKEVAAFVAASR